MGRPSKRLLVAVALLLCRCSEGTSTSGFIDISSFDLELAFPLVVTTGGSVIQLGEPFGFNAEGDLVIGSVPKLAPPPDDHRILLLGFQYATLEKVEPRFDRSRAREARLTTDGTSDCPAGRLDASQTKRTGVGIPAEALLLEIDPASEQARPATDRSELTWISLSLPIDAEGCGTADAVPFEGGQAVLGRVSAGKSVATALLRIDEDRVLVGTYGSLLYVQKGKPEPIQALDAQTVVKSIASSAAYPLSGMSTVPVVVGVEVMNAQAQTTHTRILDVELGPSGLHLVRSSSAGEGSFGGLDVRPDGTVAVVSGSSFSLRRPGRTAFETHEVFADSRLLSLTYAEGRYYLGGSLGVLFEGTGEPGGWARIDPPLEGGGAIRIFAIAQTPSPEGNTLWIGGTNGTIFRRVGTDPWQQVVLQMPPSYAGCAGIPTETCGGMPLARNVLHLIFDSGREGSDPKLFVLLRNCMGHGVLHLNSGCAGTLRLSDRPMRSELEDLSIPDFRQGEILTLGGEADSLYELDLREL